MEGFYWKGFKWKKTIGYFERGQMELQMIFTTSGSADELKYWQVLASVQNRFFQFREKLVIILSVLVDALVTFIYV
jgi:hypothetical protein